MSLKFYLVLATLPAIALIAFVLFDFWVLYPHQHPRTRKGLRTAAVVSYALGMYGLVYLSHQLSWLK